MAVANALGSNVQNVFLALALPWTLKTLFAADHSITMATPAIMDGKHFSYFFWTFSSRGQDQTTRKCDCVINKRPERDFCISGYAASLFLSAWFFSMSSIYCGLQYYLLAYS